MCGIVGLFLKDKSLEPQLGALLSEMLVTMTDRGPDSAGIAIYGGGTKGHAKVTIQSANPDADFKGLDAELGKKIGAKVSSTVKSTHAVLDVPTEKVAEARAALAELRPSVRVMGAGEAIEIYKEVGLPVEVV
ncbi:glutamate synthase domain-containing protein 1, partial [Aminobacter ciceronei]|nr:glutamate synthase domain-containing protein 1 [Aminobacter ciceronei]